LALVKWSGKPVEGSPLAAGNAKSAGNQPDLSCRAKRKSRKILSRGLSGHQDFLISELRRGRFVGDKAQPHVVAFTGRP
jgi:hypothetical protein